MGFLPKTHWQHPWLGPFCTWNPRGFIPLLSHLLSVKGKGWRATELLKAFWPRRKSWQLCGYTQMWLWAISLPESSSSPGLRFPICRVRELNQVNLKAASNLNMLWFAAKTEQKYFPGCGPKKEETQKKRWERGSKSGRDLTNGYLTNWYLTNGKGRVDTKTKMEVRNLSKK